MTSIYNPLEKNTALPISKNLLHSSYSPSREEISYYSAALEDDFKLLKHHDTEITRVSRTLEDLKRERRTISKRIHQRKSFLSPFRRVPVEIWMKICFSGEYSVSLHTGTKHIVWPSESDSGSGSEDSDWSEYLEPESEWERYEEVEALPQDLQGVCSHWHQMVDALPYLWPYIKIDGGFHLDSSPLLKKVLAKSAVCPLTIHLCLDTVFMDGYKIQQKAYALRFITVLFLHAMSRCRRLIVDSSWWEFAFSLVSDKNFSLSFPALETLETHIPESLDLSIPTSFIVNAPLLSRMKILGVAPSGTSTDLFSYSRLTSIELGRYAHRNIDFILAVLPLCVNLQSLKAPIRFSFLHNHQTVYDKPIPIPSLRHLSVDLFCLFKYFSFPGLSSLEIQWYDSSVLYGTDEQSPCFPALLTSLLGLKSLKLVLFDGNKIGLDYVKSIVGILELAPSLTVLEIEIPAPNRKFLLGDIFVLMTISGEDVRHVLVPKLSYLRIYHFGLACPHCSFTPDWTEIEKKLLQMAESRGGYSDSRIFDIRLEHGGFERHDGFCEDKSFDGSGFRMAEFFEGMEDRMRLVLEKRRIRYRVRDVPPVNSSYR